MSAAALTLRRITAEQEAQIRQDLEELGIEGSALLAIPPLDRNADSHAFVRNLILAFLRSLFRSMPDSEYVWDPEDSRTKVKIGYADPRNEAEKGLRPSITLELGSFTWGNQSINNLLSEQADGTRIYTDLRNGTGIIRCRSSVKLEADSLAAVISGAFHYMHEELEGLSGITYIDAFTQNPSSGELQQTNTEGEFFVSNVVLNIHYQETWKKTPNKRIAGPVVFVKEPKGTFLD